MADTQPERHTIVAQIEHLHMKYPGTGHADITKWEWGCNIQRDTLASHVSHHSRMMYFGVAENESIARIRARMLDKMAQPCGPAPKSE